MERWFVETFAKAGNDSGPKIVFCFAFGFVGMERGRVKEKDSEKKVGTMTPSTLDATHVWSFGRLVLLAWGMWALATFWLTFVMHALYCFLDSPRKALHRRRVGKTLGVLVAQAVAYSLLCPLVWFEILVGAGSLADLRLVEQHL